MVTLKLIITSKANLTLKYGSQFTAVKQLFTKLIAADKKKKITTKVVYIDDAASTKPFGLTSVKKVKEKECKDFVDALYKKKKPAYIVIFGAQDVFPFQELTNNVYKPDDDDDKTVPSDLPYACDSPYSKKISAFVNPVRVVGRIPDIPKTADVSNLKILFNNIIAQRPKPVADYEKYFAVTALVWENSTQQSINNIFGNYSGLLNSPPAKGGYSKKQLAALSHFYNCHGGLLDTKYYGQKGANYPIALKAKDVTNKISYGTVVAAECCYGAQLMDPEEDGFSIASNYLQNNALSFMGSSTIAYGPPKGQGLADLMCQYFMINVHAGASAGRALLEARQKFLNACGPYLDPYELKTFAQFYILGDPSLELVQDVKGKDGSNTVENRRLNLFSKGISIGQSVAPSQKVKATVKTKHKSDVNSILSQTGFSKNLKENVYEAHFSSKTTGEMKKAMQGGKTRFRTYQKSKKKQKGLFNIEVLVVKENDEQVLGYRVYVSR